MNKFYILILIPLLESCVEDANGELSLSLFGWLLIIAFIIFCVFAVINGNVTHDKSVQLLKEQGLKFSDFIPIGMYAGGHPELNNSINNVCFKKSKKEIEFFSSKLFGYDSPVKIENGNIPVDSISDIRLEDASTVEKNITLGRLALVGIFAFAWKKKKRTEVAFLVIVWKKGRFEQSTTFMFQGKTAMTMANTARNKMMKMCTEDEPEDAVATETSNKLVAEEPVTEEPVTESKHSNIGPVLLLIIIAVIFIVIALAKTINICSNMPPVDVNKSGYVDSTMVDSMYNQNTSDYN